MGEGGETYIDAQAEAFSTAIDDTYESRASTREKAWERIVALLRNNVRLDDCYQRCDAGGGRLCVGSVQGSGGEGGPTWHGSASRERLSLLPSGGLVAK